MVDPGETLFFITPLGEVGSPERRRSDFILREVLVPACDELGIRVLRADLLNEATSLLNRILQLVLEADYAVCDFAFAKPNVFYECGVRHTTGKPIVHLVGDRSSLPFDVRDFTTVLVDETMTDLLAVRGQIREMLLHAKDQRSNLNPVTMAARLADVGISIRSRVSRTAAPLTRPPGPVDNWSGRWLTNFGLVLLRQTGTRMTCAYHFHSEGLAGLAFGMIWKNWLLFEFPVANSEVWGKAFLSTAALDSYGYWVHTPELNTLDDLRAQLDRNPNEVARSAHRWRLYGRLHPDGEVETVEPSAGVSGTVAGFHLHGEPGPHGLTLSEILQFDDRELDAHPDAVAWLFPEYGPEGSFPGMGLEEANSLRKSPFCQANLRKALHLLLRFYGFHLVSGRSGPRVEKAASFDARKNEWIIVNQHHHMRITRILRSLTMFYLRGEARAFYAALLKVQQEEYRLPLRRAVKYWRLAAGFE